ncbi:MAG: acetate kinase [Candidatus Acidiferrales bacterium]
MKILVLNSGSSSQKSCLYEIGDVLPEHPPEPIWQATVEWNGDQAELRVATSGGTKLKEHPKIGSREQAVEPLFDKLWSGKARVVASPSEINVVGHRVVNGGPKFEHPVVITPEVKAAIARMSTFAPLHNRAELDGMDIAAKRFGPVPQVAVFDTGFHTRLPEAAFVYPGPYEWLAEGIRRYGFHGINHQYCAERAAQLLRKDLRSLKLVTCHLGNGCSLAAIRNGRSVDTTMGFTPLEGLMMGTRSGSVDPGILTYLMRQGGSTGQQLDDLLNEKSGLLGISGISGDMRQIVASIKEGHARAKLAFDIFVHRLRTGIGAMIAASGGIDALIFTAGIGENSAEVRAAACANFEYLNLRLNSEKNARSPQDQDIAQAGSAVRILVVRAQEDWSIAKACWKLVSARLSGLSSVDSSKGPRQ